MKKKKLLKLADMLEADAKNPKGLKFDLRKFVQVPEGVIPSLSCDTVGCALGLAMLSGKFRGLTMSDPANTWDLSNLVQFEVEGTEEVFGLTMDEVEWLFYPLHYKSQITGKRSEKAVAKRIRKFVAGTAVLPDWMRHV